MTVRMNRSCMLKIFVDFDGTITRRDVGDALFETFGGEICKEAIELYRMGDISAVECFRRECAACSRVLPSALNAFIDAQEIDPTFPSFIKYCRSQGCAISVLSDGMDYYIGRILNRCGAGDVPYFSNILHLRPVDGTPFKILPM